MKVLLDDAIPRSAAQVLTDRGYEVEDVRSCGLRAAGNMEVFDYAQKQGQLLITRDLAFLHLALRARGDHAGVLILVLCEDLSADEIAGALLRIFQQLGTRSLKNTVVIAEPHRIRIRRR